MTWRTNVLGSIRVFEAVAAANVPVLVHASSVGAYSPGSKDHAVDESWPTHGWPDAAYCREKAYLERALDTFERDRPQTRVVRMRPAFLFKRESASEQRRIFGGRFLPGPIARPDSLPFLPDVPGLRVQALHTDDAAAAYRLAVRTDVRGAFNLAAEPTVDATLLGEMFGARPVRVPRTVGPVGDRGGLGPAPAAGLAASVRRRPAAAVDGLHPRAGRAGLAAGAHGRRRCWRSSSWACGAGRASRPSRCGGGRWAEGGALRPTRSASHACPRPPVEARSPVNPSDSPDAPAR